MATKTIHDFAAITSIDAADEILAWDDSAGTTRKITWANALTGYLTTTTGLRATGATTGATSQAQTFTLGINGSTAANGDISIRGTSHATKASSYVLLQEDGGGVGIGTTTPQATLHLTTESPPIMIYETFNNTLTGVPILMRAARGTKAGPTAVGNNDILGGFSMRGYGATGFASGARAYIYAAAAEAWTDAAQGTYMLFATTPKLSTTGAERMRIIDTGYVGIGTSSPTAFLHLPAGTTSAASACINSGSRPTTPVTGDIWDDGALTSYHINATTNAVVNSLRLERGSSGTPAAGFGLGIAAQLESSTTDSQDVGRLTWAWATATHASRASAGKLTAYYTSTEREALTWTATSTGATVQAQDVFTVLNNGTSGTLRTALVLKTAESTTGTGVSVDFMEAVTVTGRISKEYEAAGQMGLTFSTYNAGLAERMRITGTGRLGIGVGNPQALIHAHDGSGGFLFVNRTGVSSTLVTVIPDAAGDVTERLHMFGWVSNSAAFVSQVNEVYLDVSSSTTKTDGSNTLTIAVTAAGAFTLQTTAGAATWKVLLWVFWR